MKRATARSIVGLAFVLGSAMAYGPITRLPPADLAGDALAWAGRLAEIVRRGVLLGYTRTPEVILGLAAVLLLPAIALAGWIARVIVRRRAARRQTRDELARSTRTALVTSPMSRAWLEVESPASPHESHEILSEIIRIGRGGDNDLALTGDGVEEFHAVIRRTPDAEFMIVDVSGNDGIAVNGRRLAHARLRNGDRIEIGSRGVTFHRAMSIRGAERAPGSVALH